MPLNRSAKSSARSAPRRSRPASPHCRGGASSLLRLAQPAASRLPNVLDLSDWMGHDDGVLMPVTGPIGAFRSCAAEAA